jgi:hypothetical protein
MTYAWVGGLVPGWLGNNIIMKNICWKFCHMVAQLVVYSPPSHLWQQKYKQIFK